jgi:hypothetical protein
MSMSKDNLRRHRSEAQKPLGIVFCLSQGVLLLLAFLLLATKSFEPSVWLRRVSFLSYAILFPFFGLVLPWTELISPKLGSAVEFPPATKRWARTLWFANLALIWINFIQEAGQ